MPRSYDIILSLFGIALLAPLFLLISLLIRIDLGRPVLYKQSRPGRHGRPFVMYKFRTMKDEYDATGALLPDEARLTKFGRYLRSSSLDELPELWNVLKGDMSLVGPRPLLMEYLPLYSPDQARRHEVRPGITGWAQVNGRNSISWDDKFKLDVWYVDNRSLSLDVKILLLTIKKVLLREGINSEGGVTVSKFTGGEL